MIYLVNPGGGRKARKRGKGSRVATRKKRRTAKQIAATKRLVALNKKRGKKRTTKKRRVVKSTRKRTAIKSRKKSTRKVGGKRTMARKRTTKRRRKGARRASTSTIRFRRVKGQVYSRNAPILKVAKQGAMDAVAVLGGGAAARVATGLLPLPQDGVSGAAAALGVAAAIGVLSRKVVSADTARMITAGAMQVPIRNLITSFVPQAGGLLGAYDGVGAYVESGVSGYALPSAPLDSIGGGDSMVGSYASSEVYG